jgi:zinc finger SWIM domain-containing protein 3
MCFRDVHQFREALINLHISQSRNYVYHRNSHVRISVQCIQENCPFYIVASEIKGEKTFVIRKMQLTHTCDTTTDTTRVSSRWLARNYEAAFRSDPNASIQTLIDSARQQHGVEIPRMMAYRAKNLALDTVLGDHRQQYVRLRDFAQTVIETNLGSRVIVTTVTPPPFEENPHPGPSFHGLFFCINGAREGFLKGCRPFIGEPEKVT